MFADNRTYGTASGCQTSFLNNTKVQQIWIMYLKLLNDLGKAETLVFEYVIKQRLKINIYLMIHVSIMMLF